MFGFRIRDETTSEFISGNNDVINTEITKNAKNFENRKNYKILQKFKTYQAIPDTYADRVISHHQN